MRRRPFKSIGTIHRVDRRLELVHADVCCHFPEKFLGEWAYMLTFIDEYSGFTFDYFLMCKSEVKSGSRDFVEFVERQTNE